MKAAVFLGHAQATGVTLGSIRSRFRDYANHHVTVDKHPHTGRVLRTVRLAFAVNVLGADFWAHASDALLADEWNGRGRVWPWSSEGERWFRAGSPVNLLRCEE